MQNILVSQHLTLIAYRISNEPGFVESLPNKIEPGTIIDGMQLSEDEADAVMLFLNTVSDEPALPVGGSDTWIA